MFVSPIHEARIIRERLLDESATDGTSGAAASTMRLGCVSLANACRAAVEDGGQAHWRRTL